MPVIQSILSHEEMFDRLSTEPIFVNNLGYRTEAERETVRNLVTTKYTHDMVSLLPSCRCGVTQGVFSMKVMCPACGSTPKHNLVNDIEPVLWFRAPNGVAPLMSPIFWIMLKNRFKKSGFNILLWLTDRNYDPSVKKPTVINKLESMGIERGYNFFVNNFDRIVDTLFSLKEFRKKKSEDDYLRVLLQTQRHAVFSGKIPLPNKVFLILEKTSLGLYVDQIITDAIDVIQTMVSIDRHHHEQTVKLKENRTACALNGLATFIENHFKVNLGPKPGQLRQHHYGTRSNSTFRCVITSITGPHNLNDIEVPWSIALTMLQPHIVNKLRKLGYRERDARAFIRTHTFKYNKTIDDVLKELIKETPQSLGIAMSIGRNPTLLQGSICYVYLSRVKTNPNDVTMGLPIPLVKCFNADFDGDAMWATMMMDNFLAEKLTGFKPYYNLYQMSGKPRALSNCISHPKPVSLTIGRWLLDEEHED